MGTKNKVFHQICGHHDKNNTFWASVILIFNYYFSIFYLSPATDVFKFQGWKVNISQFSKENLVGDSYKEDSYKNVCVCERPVGIKTYGNKKMLD